MAPQIPDLELIARAQAGDTHARNALILRHLGFVHMLIARVCKRAKFKQPYDELVAVAVAKFVQCIMLFDPSHGVKITTYSGLGIEQEVQKAINRDSPITRPYNVPDNPQHMPAWERAGRPSVDMHEPKHAPLMPSIAGDGFARLEHEERKDIVRWAFDQLNVREKSVMVMRKVDGMTLQEVGAVLGCTRERVRQIEVKAIARMKGLIAA